ncbi:Cysteine protease StiP [Xenorhabdus mauleonii]|uniref:Cysteine protease StiP n=1 Tax=Xenorhabdus mauleonii TaxID=351675 RepID=A0A1I3K9Y4_9GAMM|nr:cysteine protease StiP family protein [Xenorhabdus mauleonii]PHM44982.1 Cysteine protease StiP [Xenorhabdus mauleonii]SFI69108.1 PELOTA RNA binding domain-containing protein [Xenorhabdus mauleonii]
MNSYPPFSGSYAADDVQFLLKPVKIEMTPVDVKEQLIQSGSRHYSDMLSQEPEPTPYHLELFKKSLEQGAVRLATEVVMLAKALVSRFGDTPIVLVSLVRAGVPLGVMLHQTLRKMGKHSFHYGISIIRDRGIDETALSYIEQQHGTDGLVFVDGWTGKGAITAELSRSLAGRAGYSGIPRLVVLADPCGCSWLAASDDDWLIPFGIMGAPVSGLISRSIWQESGLHGCVQCDHLIAYECSRLLVDTVADCRDRLALDTIPEAIWRPEEKHSLLQLSKTVISNLTEKYQIDNTNRIKPGIAEATRAVLRRVPEHVLVRSQADPDVALLVHLARQKNVVITEVGDLIGQYRAVTIIKKVA